MLQSLAEFLSRASTRTYWLILVPVLAAAAGCFLLFLSRLHRSRLIRDTPTASIRSAAQGYVELEGLARMMDGEPVLSPLSGQPCVWYRYIVEQKGSDDGYWRTVESGDSESIFHLVDGTGRCIVDPEGAMVIPSVRLCWRGQVRRPGAAPFSTSFWDRYLHSGPYRYSEQRLLDGDPLYAAGEFVALGTADTAGPNEEICDLLSRWKRDRRELLKRFDADGDGQISLAEWEAARSQAEREVVATWHQRTQVTELWLLRKPANGRPFLLSSLSQHELIARYRRHALLAAGGFLALGAIAVWALRFR